MIGAQVQEVEESTYEDGVLFIFGKDQTGSNARFAFAVIEDHLVIGMNRRTKNVENSTDDAMRDMLKDAIGAVSAAP